MTISTCIAALIQNNAGNNESENCKTVFSLLEEAVSNKASIILLPEMFHFRKQVSSDVIPKHQLEDPFIHQFQQFSKKHNVALLLGSFCEGVPNTDKLYNTSVFIDRSGDIKGVYRKIHLFDALVNDTSIKESDTFLAGEKGCVVSWESYVLGLAICYDLRFPEQFRAYSNKGATVLCVPASFTYKTGTKHWIQLLQARAIENQCYVLAPNQVGQGAGGLLTYGHSVIIDPDGKILVEADDSEEGVFCAELSLDVLKKIRSSFPCLSHQKTIIL